MTWMDISATLIASGAIMLLAGTIGRLAWPGGRYSDPRPLIAIGLVLLLTGVWLAVTTTII